jgi:glycosyltransferase involved in cell wall biosynthesis
VPALSASHGGGRSTAHLIKAMAVRHDVAVLCLRRRHDGPTDGDLQRLCSAYEEIPQVGGTGATRLHRVRNRILPLLRTPGWVLGTDEPALRRRLRSLVAEWQPHVVHIAYHIMAQYADELDSCGARLVLTQHEPGVSAASDVLRHSTGVRRISAAMKRAVWANYERRMMARMDAIVAFTDEDCSALSMLAGRTPVMRIPLGVAIPQQPFSAAGNGSFVLFVGNFFHPPNVAAAVRLTRSIFPAVRQECQHARLIVVGAGPSEELRSSATAYVTVTGAVDSVDPFLDDASVVVAPMSEGGGMRVKVLEALAAGKAVVASPLAMRGLDVMNGRELLVADSDVEFASAIVKLLREPEQRIALARAARNWALSHLGWDHAAAEYEKLHDWLRDSPESKQLTLAEERAFLTPNSGDRRIRFVNAHEDGRRNRAAT